MAVSAISGYGQIQNIYAYHNSHFNQVRNAPVTPIQRAGRMTGISGEEDRLHFAAVYQPEHKTVDTSEASAIAKQTEKLKNILDGGRELQYEPSNPYDTSRMSLDGMLLAGMNIDVMA